MVIVRKQLCGKNNRNVLPTHGDDLASDHSVFKASDINSHLLAQGGSYCSLDLLAGSFRLSIDTVSTLNRTRQRTAFYGFPINDISSQ